MLSSPPERRKKYSRHSRAVHHKKFGSVGTCKRNTLSRDLTKKNLQDSENSGAALLRHDTTIVTVEGDSDSCQHSFKT